MYSTSTRNGKDTIANAKQAGEEFMDSAIEAKNDLSAAANRAGRKIRGLIDDASSEISHATEVVTTQIKDKPVQSSLVALGVGFLLGALLRR